MKTKRITLPIFLKLGLDQKELIYTTTKNLFNIHRQEWSRKVSELKVYQQTEYSKGLIEFLTDKFKKEALLANKNIL